MSMNLHNRSFLTLRDFSADEIAFILNIIRRIVTDMLNICVS